MTPEIKAKGDELIEKFYKPAYHDNRARYRATQCAIIAVKEIIDSYYEEGRLIDGMEKKEKEQTEVLNYLKSKL